MINVGILGSGFGDRVLRPCFESNQNMKVKALSSRSPDKLSHTNGISVYNDFRDLIRDPKIDLVCIALPPSFHLEASQLAISEKKHVLCEKPLGLSLDQATRLNELSLKTDKLCLVDHQLRFQPNLKKVKMLLNEDILGKISYCELTYQTGTRFDPIFPNWHWWFDKNQGGGQLMALGSHMIDILNWWFGENQKASSRFMTVHDKRPLENQMVDVTSDEIAFCDLDYENDVFVRLTVSSVDCDEPMLRLRIVGSKGTLILNQFDELLFHDAKNEIHDVSEKDNLLGKDVIGVNSWRTSLCRYAEAIAQSIMVGKNHEDVVDFNQGLNVQKVLDKLRD